MLSTPSGPTAPEEARILLCDEYLDAIRGTRAAMIRCRNEDEIEK